MKARSGFGGLLLATWMALPLALASSPAALAEAGRSIEADSSQLLARGGGRGGGGARGGGGGRSGGGGRGAGGGGRAHSGFSGAGGGLNRGSTRPSGGWSSSVGGSGARPSLDRPAARQPASRPAGGDRQAARGDRLDQRTTQRTDRQSNRLDQRTDRQDNRTDRLADRSDGRQDRIENRSDVRQDRIDNRADVRSDRIDARTDRIDRRWDSFDDRWDNYPGWARPGWGYARPWTYGWYGGWATPVWSWWGVRAATWGVATLATAAIINEAVDEAVDDHVTYITVPNSDYGLLYGTVAPVSTDGVSFEVIVNDTAVRMSADCRQGTLNGRVPSTSAEAELVNAACQVAYGNV